MAALQAQNAVLVTSDLSRTECRTGPLKVSNPRVLAKFDTFFTANVQMLALSVAVCERASELRANYGFKTPDALHLAAAIVHGCDVFLTNDTRLNRCTEIQIEGLT